MTKWEYLVRNFHIEHRNVHPFLDELGNKGWELVQVIGRETFVFKKPVEAMKKEGE